MASLKVRWPDRDGLQVLLMKLPSHSLFLSSLRSPHRSSPPPPECWDTLWWSRTRDWSWTGHPAWCCRSHSWGRLCSSWSDPRPSRRWRWRRCCCRISDGRGRREPDSRPRRGGRRGRTWSRHTNSRSSSICCGNCLWSRARLEGGWSWQFSSGDLCFLPRRLLSSSSSPGCLRMLISASSRLACCPGSESTRRISQHLRLESWEISGVETGCVLWNSKNRKVWVGKKIWVKLQNISKIGPQVVIRQDYHEEKTCLFRNFLKPIRKICFKHLLILRIRFSG